MSIEASLPLARTPAPSFPPPERGAVTATIAEQPVLSRRTPASPLLAHIARFADGSPMPATDVEGMLQLATHQEALFLEKQRAMAGEALRHSPWPALADADPDDQRAQQVMQEARRAMQDLVPQNLLQDAEQRAGGSHRDLFEEIAALIGRLDAEWIRKYSEILGGYVEFYRELTDALKDLKDYLGTPDSSGNSNVNFQKLVEALEALKAKWASKGFGPVFDTREKADRFLKELGIEDLVLIQVDGGWQIGIDSAVIDSLISVFPLGPWEIILKPPYQQRKPYKLSSVALAEMMTQKEIMMERFHVINRALPEKYQRQLQSWDMLVKVLSSTIDAVTEADRAVVQAMAG